MGPCTVTGRMCSLTMMRLPARKRLADFALAYRLRISRLCACRGEAERIVVAFDAPVVAATKGPTDVCAVVLSRLLTQVSVFDARTPPRMLSRTLLPAAARAGGGLDKVTGGAGQGRV